MGFGIQPIHIVVIIIVALLIFGPRKLPEMGRSIGKAINEFRNGTRDITDTLSQEINRPVDSQTRNDPPATTNYPSPSASIPFQAPSIAPPRSGNFCIQCGATNLLEARFCNQCGTKLPEKKIQPPGISELNQ
jgi:sec-independent protein translocase protein TatA